MDWIGFLDLLRTKIESGRCYIYTVLLQSLWVLFVYVTSHVDIEPILLLTFVTTF